MNTTVQYVMKLSLLLVAAVLAALHDLSPAIAAVLGSGLVALGMTNGASIVAGAAQLGTAVPPPAKPPVAAVAPIAGVMLFFVLFALPFASVACSAAQQQQDEVAAQKAVDELCKVNAAREADARARRGEGNRTVSIEKWLADHQFIDKKPKPNKRRRTKAERKRERAQLAEHTKMHSEAMRK